MITETSCSVCKCPIYNVPRDRGDYYCQLCRTRVPVVRKQYPIPHLNGKIVERHPLPECGYIDVDVCVQRGQTGGTYGIRKTIMSPVKLTTKRLENRGTSWRVWDYTERILSEKTDWFVVVEWLNSQTRSSGTPKIIVFGDAPDISTWKDEITYVEEV